MKKRLLLSLLAVCTAVAGFALEVNEYVYTPQGRFKIIDNPVKTVNFDKELTGWTGVSATEGKAAKDIFVWNENGCADGIHSVKSDDATAGEGMYMKFEPNGQTYVVSFKMKGAEGVSTRVKTDILSTNLVKVQGNSDGVYGGTTDVFTVNKAEDLSSGDWQTFSYAISGEATSLVYFISFTGMATNIEIADLQIAPAAQVADLRQRDAMIEKMEAYKNVYDWDASLLEDYSEVLGALKGIGDESSQGELNEALEPCVEVLNGFLKDNMDDYLAGTNRDNYFDTWRTKWQKQSKIGDWTILPSGRGFWENNGQSSPDLGHYAGSQKWGDMTMGVYMQKELAAGSYVFTIEGKAAYRENASSSTWANNDGLKVGLATAYIVHIVNGEAADTLASVHQVLDPLDFTPAVIAVKTTEDGTYEIGYKVISKYPETIAGGVTYVANASLWGKNDNKYNQKQLGYEADVREQITTGRTQLTTANEYIANADYLWGKTELQACVDTVEVKIAAYELLDQDAIIATYNQYIEDNGEDSYKKATNDPAGILVYEVYQEAVKDIIAANKKFVAVNDTLNSLQVAIDAAEATLALRVYDAATGKGDLKAQIGDAKELLAAMKKLEYSEENASFIEAEKLVLSEAVETFKASVPASEIAEIISVDFEQGATLNAETGNYEAAGNNTTMVIENFSETTPETNEKGVGEMKFELGIDSNGEKELPGVLRIGSGSAYAEIPAKDYGTNILKVSMDFWFIRLTDGLVGFELTDANEERVAGMKFVPYNNNLGSAGFDSFGISDFGNFFKSNTSGDAASCADNNISHIECIFDYGEKSMYLVSTNASGSFTTDKVAFNGLVPTKITISSNYKNYPGRRCWFDNLKIEQVTAGATEQFVDGIEEIANPETEVKAPAKYFKNGRIVINGKYGINGVLIK